MFKDGHLFHVHIFCVFFWGGGEDTVRFLYVSRLYLNYFFVLLIDHKFCPNPDFRGNEMSSSRPRLILTAIQKAMNIRPNRYFTSTFLKTF